MKIPCSVEILTLNSEKTLQRCLESVLDFDDVMVLDGNSTDRTVEIAKEFGARVIPQSDTLGKDLKIEDFSIVRNKGIQLARYPWFLYIDSDEYLSPEAGDEIRKIVARGDKNVHCAYKLPRKYVVEGQVVERSSMYPNYQMRFFYIPTTSGFIKKVHERISIKEGCEVGILKNPEYVPMEDIVLLKKKWYNYARVQVATNNVVPSTLIKFILNNLLTFAKYLIKYTMTFIRGNGKRMPFSYEWYNAYYHIWLIQEALIAFARGKK